MCLASWNVMSVTMNLDNEKEIRESFAMYDKDEEELPLW